MRGHTIFVHDQRILAGERGAGGGWGGFSGEGWSLGRWSAAVSPAATLGGGVGGASRGDGLEQHS